MKKIHKTAALLLALALLMGGALPAAAADDAVAGVRALLEGLPTADEVKAMDLRGRRAAYDRTQAAYDAYQALTDGQKARLPGAEEAFASLFEFFNSLVMPLAGGAAAEENPDTGPGSLISWWAHWLAGLLR